MTGVNQKILLNEVPVLGKLINFAIDTVPEIHH